MRDVWDATLSATTLATATKTESTTRDEGEEREGQVSQKDKETEVQKGHRSLCLSASVRRTFNNGVVVNVALVGTRVTSDTNCQCSSGRESEDKVQKVNNK